MAAATTKATLTFLDLPAEIRNEIYMHSLYSPSPIELPYAYEHVRFHEPALLSTHPIIRREATPLFFGTNTFSPPSPASAQAFLKQLPAAKIAWIRKFRASELVIPATGDEKWFEVIQNNLNKVIQAGGRELKVDAVKVMAKRRGGDVKWCGIGEIEGWEVKWETGQQWRVQWKGATAGGQRG